MTLRTRKPNRVVNGVLEQLAVRARRQAHLELLVLHGSRARSDAQPGSDWDFAYLARPGFDRELFVADIVRIVATEAVDFADLARSSALLRFRAARDGVCVYADPPEAHERFILAAALFWCDIELVLRRAYDGVLADLG